VTGVYGKLTLSIPSRNVSVDTTCIEPSKTPTSTPQPSLSAQGVCNEKAEAIFTVTNNGGKMLAGEGYVVKDEKGTVAKSGTIKLDSGASTTIQVTGIYGKLTLTIPGLNITVDTVCAVPPTGTPVVNLPTPTPTTTATKPAPKCGYTTLGSDGFPVMDETACAPDQPLPRPAWTPITVGAGVCPVWSVYHTNHATPGGWEILRLGNLPDDPTAPTNLSQGNKKGVYSIKPSLSPDRKWFAFTTNRDGNWEVYVGATNGRSKPVRVTYRQYATSTDPVWSPNGQYIMYESNRDGNWELYMFDVTNGQETRLTENRATDTNAFWSPDSTKIIFQSLRDKIWQIYELDVKTLDVKRLSDGKGTDRNPEYSHDGKLVVFNTNRDGSNGVIALMNADGTGLQTISDAKGDANNTAWSPDDKLIAYQSFIPGTEKNIGVFVYELATGKTRLVTETTNYASISPSWYCGTTDLLFTSNATGNNEVFTVSAVPISAPPIDVKKDATQLTHNPGFSNQYPENSPAEEDASNRWVNLPTE
jgi:Tol biopolymer transport system component